MKRYGNDVLRIVRRYLARETRSMLDSADVAQSVWRSFFRRELPAHDFNDEQELRAILLRLARSKVLNANRRYLDRQRRDLRRDCSLDELSVADRQGIMDTHPSPLDMIQAEEAVETLIACLPPRYRPVVGWLCEGYTHQEIAERLGCMERTVGRLVERLREHPHWKFLIDPG